MSRALRALAVLAGLAVVVLAVGAAVPGLDALNPFRERTKDRSQPVLLRELERLSEYRATSANMEVVVDVEQDNTVLPGFLKGTKTLLVAGGNVDASVDFSGLSRDAVKVNGDRTAVTIDLPRATLGDARVDLDRTRVFDRDRGLLDRIGDALGDGSADEERKLLQLAQQKLADAARSNPEILRSAERNTTSMLEGMMRGLGFERVTVRFAPLPAT